MLDILKMRGYDWFNIKDKGRFDMKKHTIAVIRKSKLGSGARG